MATAKLEADGLFDDRPHLLYCFIYTKTPLMKDIILASSSPRRKEIFSKTGLPFTVEHSEYEEDMTLPVSPTELVQHLADGKAKAVSDRHPDSLIIAADTIIAFGGRVLGKPKSKDEAIRTLSALSGKENDIITGVTIQDGKTGKNVRFADTTKIFMKEISESDIAAYVDTGEPMNKAGSYALQGLGAIFIERIEGDFFSAMGLPLARLVEQLKAFGVRVL